MVKSEPFPPEACDNEHAVVVAKTTSQKYCTFHGLRIEPAVYFISSSLDLACVSVEVSRDSTDAQMWAGSQAAGLTV